MLEFIVMGMVYEQELTGYDIKKMIEKGVGVFYRASYGSLYPLLGRLTGKGLLTMREQPQGGRARKLYRATEQGRQAFMSWLSTPVEVADGRDTQLVKVYFFDRLPRMQRDCQLRAYEENNRRFLEKLRGLEKQFDKRENRDAHYYKLSTLYYGIGILEETLRWCEKVREERPFSDGKEGE
ncbi:MAG: PadR family transcriptional regulator [Clostridiales bacterium]|jgi:DNA-binding PadR family transcriptional regulator|nr:PadR family transcriptional regulator [Clostridiales bacterium]